MMVLVDKHFQFFLEEQVLSTFSLKLVLLFVSSLLVVAASIWTSLLVGASIC